MSGGEPGPHGDLSCNCRAQSKLLRSQDLRQLHNPPATHVQPSWPTTRRKAWQEAFRGTTTALSKVNPHTEHVDLATSAILDTTRTYKRVALEDSLTSPPIKESLIYSATFHLNYPALLASTFLKAKAEKEISLMLD